MKKFLFCICLIISSCDTNTNDSQSQDISQEKVLTTKTITINQSVEGTNVARPVIIQTPNNINQSKNYPVVFAFHGRGGKNTGWVNKLKNLLIMGISLGYTLKGI